MPSTTVAAGLLADPRQSDELCRYATRPWAFLFRYLSGRPYAHSAILLGVIGAVACSVGTQYGVKGLVDALAQGPGSNQVWSALLILAGLIAADNMLWRVASLMASFTFVRVTGDLRRDLFRHLTGHGPAFFADRPPGTVASRVTATSNAFFTVENMFVWNVLPPCIAAAASIGLIASVSTLMAVTLAGVFGVVIIVMFRIAAAGRPLHHDFADKAAAVDGDIVDVVGNMSLVKAFGGIAREARRFDGTLEREMTSRRRSLLYLERLRVIHALITIVSTLVLLIWVVNLWQAGQASAGQVVLVCTLGLSILSATRDLAIALVDVTQHTARLSEAIATLLVPHQLRDHPEASTLVSRSASVTLENVAFSYPSGRGIYKDMNLHIEAGQWVGLVGPSGGGKSTLFSLLQRFYDLQGGRILIDGQDIGRVTQESLREAITVVPQDISLFHRTLLENIRYGRPDASDEDVWQAAQAAQCSEFIDMLPEGLDTMVGDRGVKLSGGQRQRIAIARAILKNAPILLLDEATSALDSRSEAHVRAALANLMQGRTVIAIAHRLSTLAGFHRIVTIQDGSVVGDDAADAVLSRIGPTGVIEAAPLREAVAA
jgi:ATP-binding cassette subfamily B protein